MAIDSGTAFLLVLAGGAVTTFIAVAMIHMIRDGRALRAREAAARALPCSECGGSSDLPSPQCTRAHASLVRQQAEVSQPSGARER